MPVRGRVCVFARHRARDAETPRRGRRARPLFRRRAPDATPVPAFGARRRNVGNKAKCSVFRRWVLETFGHAFLCSGAGVLDVAGGKGELAFELRNVSGVPVTVVDPRPMRLDAYVRKFRAGYYHRNRAPAVVASVLRPQDAPLAAPEHCRVFFFPRRARATRGSRAGSAARASWRAARETRWSRRGLVASADENADDGGDEHTSDAVTNTPSHDATGTVGVGVGTDEKAQKSHANVSRMERPVPRARRARAPARIVRVEKGEHRARWSFVTT